MLHRCFLIILGSLFSTSVLAVELYPFHASYTADWKQLPFSGKAERSLQNVAPGQWRLTFEASMMVAGMSESSELRLQDNGIQPLKYRYNRTALGKSKKVAQDFNWQNYSVTGKVGKEGYELPLLAGMLDKSSYQLALQLDVAKGLKAMSYTVLDGDDFDTYDFRVLGEEPINTPVGTLHTIKVERVRDPTQSQRKTVLWFAKDLDFLLVQLHQIEKDGKEYTIILEHATVNGEEVSEQIQ